MKNWTASIVLAVAGLLTLPTAARADGDMFMVHVRDAWTVNGLGVIVLEACQPRPISQGQVVFEIEGVSKIVKTRVISRNKDATFAASQNGAGQVLLTFSSDTSSINMDEGAIALIAFRTDLPVGTELPIAIDDTQSFMNDELGNQIHLMPTPGTLHVGRVDDPFRIYALTDYGFIGDQIEIKLLTSQLVRASQASITVTYDSSLFKVADVRILPKSKDQISEVIYGDGTLTFLLSSMSGKVNNYTGTGQIVVLRLCNELDESAFDVPDDLCTATFTDGRDREFSTAGIELGDDGGD